MITTTIPLTLSLAIAIGLYMVAGGLSGLINDNLWPRVLDGFRSSPALTYLAGIVTFAIGATLIMVHSVWTDPLAGFISLIGWVAAAEGLVIIAKPDLLLDLSASLIKPALTRGFSIGVIVLGAVLLLLGLTGRAGS